MSVPEYEPQKIGIFPVFVRYSSIVQTTSVPNLIEYEDLSSTIDIGGSIESSTGFLKRRIDLSSHLESLVAKKVIQFSDLQEIMFQHYMLEMRRNELSSHEGEVVVVSNTELFFGKTINEALELARKKWGERPYYSETVNMVDYPSIFYL